MGNAFRRYTLYLPFHWHVGRPLIASDVTWFPEWHATRVWRARDVREHAPYRRHWQERELRFWAADPLISPQRPFRQLFQARRHNLFSPFFETLPGSVVWRI